MTEELSKCSLCKKEKHTGFINFENYKTYRLCKEHYTQWLVTKEDLEIFIRTKQQEISNNQTKLVN